MALALAAIGIYGVADYSVSRSMHEMGVRMALGATGSNILRMVMREGFILTIAGMFLGVAAALAVSRQLQSFVFGISSTDPLTYALATVVIPAAAMLGCWRPAARAAAANPVDAIRSEYMVRINIVLGRNFRPISSSNPLTAARRVHKNQRGAIHGNTHSRH